MTRLVLATLASALFALPLCADPAADLQSLVEAERAFARAAAEKGTRAAFLEFLADDAVVFRPNPVSARRWFMQRPETLVLLEWEPAYAEISRDGDLGYTVGPWALREKPNDPEPAAFGHYVTVWRRQGGGDWKAVADIGISHSRDSSAISLSTRLPQNDLPPDTSLHDAPARRMELLDADSAFFAAANESLLEAWRGFATESIRILRPDSLPAIGLDAGSALQPDGALEGKMAFADVSWSGDLGYTYGNQRFRPAGAAEASAQSFSYLRIWRREPPGHWRVALDIAVSAESESP